MIPGCGMSCPYYLTVKDTHRHCDPSHLRPSGLHFTISKQRGFLSVHMHIHHLHVFICFKLRPLPIILTKDLLMLSYVLPISYRLCGHDTAAPPLSRARSESSHSYDCARSYPSTCSIPKCLRGLWSSGTDELKGGSLC